jgi:O-Antigen ligase
MLNQTALISPVAGRHHDILLATLISVRPLIWSGDASAWDNLAWLMLVGVALLSLVVDAWRGRLVTWNYGFGGVIAAIFLLILLPAALSSPYPATGMGLWGMAVIHLGFAAYVLQVIGGRERLAFGALMGALVVECCIALGQWWWVLPRMTTALAAGDPQVMAMENANGDLAERLANGGIFGTFTLANTLAAFLLLAGIPCLAMIRHTTHLTRLIVASISVLVCVVAVGTSSKGAAVAFVIAIACVWTWQVKNRWRLVPLIGVLLLGILCLSVPQLRHLGAASAEVRLGYWQGATTLIAEAPVLGHGIHSFSAHGPRVMPLNAEPTQHVHNDILEATVDGGLLAGLTLALLLLWSARARTVIIPHFNETISNNDKRVLKATWPLLIFIPFFAALGMLQSNIGWWPAGGDETWWLWPLVLALTSMGVTILIARSEWPPAWAFQLALAAFAVHCLVDFNLQSPPIWGTFIVVAVLAGGQVYAIGVCNISRSVVTALALGLIVSLIVGIKLDAGRGPITQSSSIAATGHQRFQTANQWPARLDLAMEVLSNLPPNGDRLPLSQDLYNRYTWNGSVLELLAQDSAATGDYNAAINHMEKAVALAPANIPRRKRFIDLMTVVAEVQPSQKNQLQQRIISESKRIEELKLLVHVRNQ